MIVTVGDASPRQARGHIGDGCVKWKHFLNDVADEFKAWFPYDHNSDCFHMSPTDRGHVAEASPTVTIIWKPGLIADLCTFPLTEALTSGAAK